MSRTLTPPRSKVVEEACLLRVGTRIDFGDEGTGRITARKGTRVFIQSAVLNGWMEEGDLIPLLEFTEVGGAG